MQQTIDINELNEYSTKVYEYLLNNNKELIEYITLFPSDFGKKYINIKLESPNKEQQLFLLTEHEELTVGFSDFHCHFDSFANLDFEVEIKNAIDCFYKILNEDLLVFCAGGAATMLLSKKEIEKLESGQKIENFKYDHCITFYVSSWSGKYDRVFKNPN
ncbi:hypothetical protein [Flavobacterium sp. LB3R33]|uniref:hypothetical protein n=1 Tax=Flavobacterium sp. LB3R33 TaxID=3401721 RepID=UPI003AAD0766